MSELESRSKNSSIDYSVAFHEIEVDKQSIIKAHLANLKEEMLHEFTLLSKVKFSDSLSDEKLLYEFKKRFELTIPLSHIDCVFV